MFVILIAIAMSEPRVTSGLSVLITSVNFGLSGPVWPKVTLENATGARSTSAKTFIDFVIDPPPAVHHLNSTWDRQKRLQASRGRSMLDTHRAIGSALSEHSQRDRHLCQSGSIPVESSFDLMDSLNLCCWLE